MIATRLSAPWVLPMDGPPVADGAVVIGDDGRIAAVGPAAAVARPAGAADLRFDDAVLIPGLVNAHTHLELTGIGGVADDDFTAWIRSLRAAKAERGPADFRTAAQAGVAACLRAGVTCVADTGDSGAVLGALREAGMAGVYYHEVFGPDPAQLPESIDGLAAALEVLWRGPAGRARFGVSPHAPYSVSGPLYRAAAALARSRALPVAMHLAESAAESALVERGAGAFAQLWAARGIARPPAPGRTPVAWLDEHAALGPDALAIHLVRVSAEDIATLRARGVAVAHCPLSNRRHGHGDAPLRALLDAGLRVGVGTDSEASLGTLDLFAEVRAARALAGLDAPRALALVTVGAARAIGAEAGVGALVAGGAADVVAVRTGPVADPYEAVVAAAPRDVIATWVSGRRVAAP